MPPRKRAAPYRPPAQPARVRPAESPNYSGPNVVSIDMKARAGRPGLSVGDRVRITGTGLYSGEAARIDRFASGAIPSAVVTTEAGRTRQVRTVDLEPIGPDD